MSRSGQSVLVLLTVFSCVGCDQATKAVAKAHLPRREVLSFGGDVLRLQYAENRGGFLSLGDQIPEGWRTFLFTGLVGGFLALLLLYLLSARSRAPRELFALSLVCGGGLGNLIDRAARAGYVVDFMNCGVGSLRTGIFNAADVAILLGVAMLVFESVTRHRDSRKPGRP